MADKYTPERATSGKERLRTWWKKVENNFVKIFGAVSKHIDGTADRHTADMIDYSDTETVKAKLNSTDTKLDTKVDKVSGKSLIDSDVADNLKYSQMEGSDRLSFDGEIKATHIQAVAIDAEHGIHCGGDVGVNVGDVFTTRMDDDTGSPVTHYLSKKANAADIVNKVDKIEGKSLIDENVADRLSYDSTTTNIVVSSISQGVEARNFIGMDGNASISANGLISGQHLTIETDGADNIPGVVGIEAKNGDVTANVCIDPNSGAYKLHKLSEKVDKVEVLTKTNATEFTPMADYQPATKKYVDDTIKAAIEKYNTEAMALLGED